MSKTKVILRGKINISILNLNEAQLCFVATMIRHVQEMDEKKRQLVRAFADGLMKA